MKGRAQAGLFLGPQPIPRRPPGSHEEGLLRITASPRTAAELRRDGRPAPCPSAGAWVEPLRRSDVCRLWTELQRLVVNHPLVRASHSAGLLVEEGDRGSAYLDLTQELFVTLLAKSRFQHYLDTGMTDAEIECEIGQIELTNLLTAELRKRHPESLPARAPHLDHHPVLGQLPPLRQDGRRRRARTSSTAASWTASTAFGVARRQAAPRQPELEQRVQLIPVRQRDTRMVGCTGDAQIIISNSDLEDLIVSVLEACDSPADVRTLRSLVMSRLPVMDIYLVPIGGDDGDEGRAFEPVDGRENPEQSLLRRESEREAAGFVDDFLKGLHAAVRGKTKQYDRMLGVLWHCYLSPVHVTQLEAAARLNVSDSLVSDYRRRIEQMLRASPSRRSRRRAASRRRCVGRWLSCGPTRLPENIKWFSAREASRTLLRAGRPMWDRPVRCAERTRRSRAKARSAPPLHCAPSK